MFKFNIYFSYLSMSAILLLGNDCWCSDNWQEDESAPKPSPIKKHPRSDQQDDNEAEILADTENHSPPKLGRKKIKAKFNGGALAIHAGNIFPAVEGEAEEAVHTLPNISSVTFLDPGLKTKFSDLDSFKTELTAQTNCIAQAISKLQGCADTLDVLIQKHFSVHHPSKSDLLTMQQYVVELLGTKVRNISLKNPYSDYLNDTLSTAIVEDNELIDTKYTFSEDRRLGIVNIKARYPEFLVYAFWINDFFLKAKNNQANGSLGVFHNDLENFSNFFETLLCDTNLYINFVHKAENDCQLNWPSKFGNSHADVIALQTTWNRAKEKLDADFKVYTDTLSNVFVAYLYSTGIRKEEICHDLLAMCLSELNVDNSASVRLMSKKEHLYGFMPFSLQNQDENPISLSNLNNHAGLLLQIQSFLNSFETIYNLPLPTSEEKVDLFQRNMTTVLNAHNDHILWGYYGATKEILTRARNLHDEGFVLYATLAFLNQNMDRENNLGLLIQGINCWWTFEHKLKGFSAEYLPKRVAPKSAKVGFDYFPRLL